MKATKQNKKLIEKMGEARKTHEGLRAFARRVAHMENQRKQLTQKYPDKWVAMAEFDIVAVADSLDEILSELDRKKVSRSDAVVEFLNTQPQTMVL